MMLSDITSRDIQPKFYPSQDVLSSSSTEKISASFDRWPLQPFSSLQELSPIIQINNSSSIYWSSEFKSETKLHEEFLRRIEQIRVLEDISGMLNELTAEQMAIFEEAVKRRPLFR